MPLPHLRHTEAEQCFRGSYLVLYFFEVLGIIASQGNWGLHEHPRDRGRSPYCSVYHSAQADYLC
eukprot:4425163-Lingulodinium_polyedra.AAC.1